MTGRERLMAILRRQPADQLAWTTLVDKATLDLLPEHLRGNGGLDFYRHLECDICLLNGWGTPHQFPRALRFKWPDWVKTSQEQKNNIATRRYETKRGTLTAHTEKGHPLKYLVETLEDLRIFREMYAGVEFVEAVDDRPAYAAANRLVGPAGIVTCFPGPSAIPYLLENIMGTVNFYYLYNDHPAAVAELIEIIHRHELKIWEQIARGPWDVVILAENTSTYYISPDLYRRFNGPHQRDFVEVMHAGGKIAILHMCGHVRDLLKDIQATGADGIHALTPPPTGNTPWELALDELGDELIIFGILDPSIFILGPAADIPRALDALYTPRLRRSHFILWPAADGIPVPQERFEAVATWMRAQR